MGTRYHELCQSCTTILSHEFYISHCPAIHPGLQIPLPWLRNAAKLVAAYQQALRPRLMVPFLLAVLMAAYNKNSEQPLELLYQGCLLGGFLSYKIALILKIADDNAPKVSYMVVVHAMRLCLLSFEHHCISCQHATGRGHVAAIAIAPATMPWAQF